MSKQVYQFIVKHPDTTLMVVAEDTVSAFDAALGKLDDRRSEIRIGCVTDYSKFLSMFPKEKKSKKK